MKKYSAEFGLHAYCSWKTIIPLEDLENFDDGRNYHIYMILSRPRLVIDKNSIIVNQNGISMNIISNDNGEEREIAINDFNEGLLDYRKAKIECKYPYDGLDIEFEVQYLNEVYDQFKKYSKGYGMDILKKEDFIKVCNSIRGVDYIYDSKNGKNNYEILYIGQAFGRNGNRTAKNRFKNHEKVQKILTDVMSKRPDRRLYVLLLEMSFNLNSVFDGKTKSFMCSEEESERHLKEVVGTEIEKKQNINITEAAFINYFKPEYNVNFVNNFPSETHTGYKKYFDLDYNSIVIELDLEFDNIDIGIYTEENEMKSFINIIRYKLFNDDNRDSMYKIFKK